MATPSSNYTFTGTQFSVPASETEQTDITAFLINALAALEGHDHSATRGLAVTRLGTVTSSLAFSGTGLKITGDLSNATHASRLLVQSSTTNGATALGVIPNGTSIVSQLFLYDAPTPDNAGHLTMRAAGIIDTNKVGTGTAPNLVLRAGGNNAITLAAASGNTTINGNIGFYNTSPGAKPTVTGSRSANAALASLLTGLATLGLLTDSTTA